MNVPAYEQLTLFPAASPASRSPSPGSDEAREMTVTSGLRCCELLRSSGPAGCLVKMLLASSIWRSTRCFLTWKPSVTPGGRSLFLLRPSTPRTGGTDAPSWPTPTAADTYTGRMKSTQQKAGSMHSVNLAAAINMWPTPKATDYKGSGPAGTKSAEHDLKKHNLKGVVMFYPTPTTGAGLCGGSGNYQQLKDLEARGQITEEERRSMAAGNGGQLNPDWVEWLMGFPPGWTEA